MRGSEGAGHPDAQSQGSLPSSGRILPADWAAALALVLAHLALKTWRLGRSDLWLDEAGSVHFAQLAPARLVAAVQHDTNPPLYYLVLSGWGRLFGCSEAAMRWPSALASALTGGVLYLLARRMGGRFVAWATSAIFLASTANIAFARQARPYTLAALLCCVSFALLLRAIERPTWARMSGVAVVNALACSTHYLVVFAVAMQLLALVAPWRGWKAVRRFAVAHAVLAFAAMPWLIPVLRQSGKMNWLAVPGTHQVLGLVGAYAGRSVPMFFTLAIAAGAAVIVARQGGVRVPWPTFAPVLLWAFGPIAAALLVSRWVRCFHERYLLYVTPALALSFALSIGLLTSRRWRAVLASAAVVALSARLRFGYDEGAFAWRAAVDAVRAQAPGRVLIVPPYDYAAFAYYFDAEAFRDFDRTRERLAARGVRLVGGPEPLAGADLGVAERIALVESATAARQERDRVRQALATSGLTVGEPRVFRGVVVSELERGAAALAR